MSSNYYPILKTTVSEIRALKQFDCSNETIVHPIFELTKSRKSKYDEIGDVYKRIQEISDLVQKNSFYLDLTSEESLSNPQIESFFDDYNSFYNWRTFIEGLIDNGLAVIPVIQAFDDSSIEELKDQMSFFYGLCGSFSIRIKPEYLDMEISKNLIISAQAYDFTTILDAEFIDDNNFNYSKKIFSSFLTEVESDGLTLGKIISCCSSFPAMVNHENKESGEFNIYEKIFYSELIKKFPHFDINYGDYASVHPFRNEVMAYNWVPRIDYPTEGKVVFCRKQRQLGGYKDCATRMITNPTYQSNIITCWGSKEIIDACTLPNGKSPSYWISVRINIHMSRCLDWLKQNNSITP
tara:strand:+ start:2949 stop:4004 length:1056 start_codon:yes stop_codon:yes gene_type:complete